MKLDTEEYKSCATEEEIENLLKSCSEISEWIYEDGVNAEATVYEEKLAKLKQAANNIYARHWEHNERPEALNALRSMINGSESFLSSAKNLTIDKNPDRGVFTEVEINNLENIIKETIAWRDTEIKEQEKLKKYEPVRLTVKMITEKMSQLDREVKYLVNKIKLWRPKSPPKEESNKVKNETEEPTKDKNETENEKESVLEEENNLKAEENMKAENNIKAEENESKTLDDAENHSEL